jgi:hypothetical protein
MPVFERKLSRQNVRAPGPFLMLRIWIALAFAGLIVFSVVQLLRHWTG